METGAYPVVEMPGVDPLFVEVQMRQRMATRYMQACPDLDRDAANDAADATWFTEWPDDPEPRTFEAANQVVDDDLSYWGEE
ncbi:hypothetical protein [Sphingomonas abietis]|uniref:Uncharacterized protein n=1 Tax=Sphingomonas abietis TaxID=3012344 RepID=A0ABY7NQT6_9SPHN|nr:hypothetical protein [Sphingomonas abietis]WBO23904.1 hypothetical protein PBT88_07290 [Sphingomonas abietis]